MTLLNFEADAQNGQRIFTTTLIASSTPVSGVSDGRRHFGEREGMGVDQLGFEALLRHQCRGAVGRTLAFAADAEHVDVVAHEIGEVDRHRIGREGGDANPMRSDRRS